MRVDNQLLMLMEFVEGVTLDQKLKEGPLPPGEAVNYIMQVLAALEYAHARGVVHRDIKPANMMLTAGGVVKLMDIGIAAAHFCLQATELGLGTCMLGWFDEAEIKRILRIPRAVRVALVITVGYEAGTAPERAKARKTTEAMSNWNQY